ncbi:GNAT family N-acetyltransferase [filamentous cyanobacterium CCP2]|nr:GNAT family N-acetyltransferase [filamentous cyanobacterium CCP2]
MIHFQSVDAAGIRLSVDEDGKEVGRAYLYIMQNDLHDEPFGLMENVWVDETYRGQGIGSDLVNTIIQQAKEKGCYKLIATSRSSRSQVHELYKRLGFEAYGIEFRMNFSSLNP